MADLQTRTTDSGTWIRIRTDYAIPLSAYRADDEDDTPLTVYWRGRTDQKSMHGFFLSALRDSGNPTFTVRAFTPDENLQFDALRDGRMLLNKVPKEACFLRLEADLGPGEDQVIDEFIVWARTDLTHVKAGADAPDDIGVYLKPSRLKALIDLLVRFIRETQIAEVGEKDVRDCIELLAAYLRPHRPAPLEA